MHWLIALILVVGCATPLGKAHDFSNGSTDVARLETEAGWASGTIAITTIDGTETRSNPDVAAIYAMYAPGTVGVGEPRIAIVPAGERSIGLTYSFLDLNDTLVTKRMVKTLKERQIPDYRGKYLLFTHDETVSFVAKTGATYRISQMWDDARQSMHFHVLECSAPPTCLRIEVRTSFQRTTVEGR
jgi:hypothetical protein